MKTSRSISFPLVLLLTVAAGLSSSNAFAQAAVGGIDVSQQPLFTQVQEAPLNMLVMGKDHKIYYEAYNDASDLNNDGALDIGYKPAIIDYFGNFNSNVCYVWSVDKFEPSSATADKKCSGKWSGDFLNYVTTSRMDALRRVLYGGWRQVDSTTDTILQGAYFPQEGHAWGKEYQSVARDGYDIAEYAPLTAPQTGRYILFAVTTLKGNSLAYPNYQAPVMRVLYNTDKRVWNWLSIEGPVAGIRCFNTSNARVDCVPAATVDTWNAVPSGQFQNLTITTWKRSGPGGSPGDLAAMNAYFSVQAVLGNLCGTGPVANIDTTGNNNNPFTGGGCNNNNYLTQIQGDLLVPVAGNYRFAVDGNDAVDVTIDGNPVVGWYGSHNNDRSAAALMLHSANVFLTAGVHTVRFRHQQNSGGNDNWGLLRLLPAATVTLTDYQARVQSCPVSDATLRESTCKLYPNGQYKPTGILHDYGETSRMYFGLITGTQYNNLEGGVLRRNMGSFGDEIDPDDGTFKTSVDGIANTINEFRMIGGGYNSGTDNTFADSNWNWGNGTGTCESQGHRALNNGECRMWGNPLAEMLYESMRYYAGAAAPTPRFNATSSPGIGEETTMNLKKDTWKDPYEPTATGGGGFAVCARPFQTIISDINPSYDGDLPGSAFTGAITSTGATPATISGFDAASEGQTIWNAEFLGASQSVFIGDVDNVTDGVPTAKTASSFGNIRGLSPEEPSKGGTYYSASVAHFARQNDLNAAAGSQKVSTYAIALASPLPRIEFPVGVGKITMVPFGKTTSGTFGTGPGPRRGTNTIVDFYVELIANLPGQPATPAINGGRPYAVFRINYEDVEQGNDHDMDAIVRYQIRANVDGTVTVTLNSEYAAGSADQNLGYVMSGSTQDGVYLDVKDLDSGPGSFAPYPFNTPNPLLPGDCAAAPPAACNFQLPLTSTRVFTPTPTGTSGGAIFLNDPLWYAAKYGAPQPANNDVDGDGVPDNYFLVTNPATLRTQLDKAFQDIIANSLPSASIATSAPRYVQGSSLAYEVSYNSVDWTGDLRAFELAADGTYVSTSPVWSASAQQPAHGSRNIFTGERAGPVLNGVPFTQAGLSAPTRTAIQGILDPAVFVPSELIDFLRGDKSREVGGSTCTPATCMYRKRSSRLGDVLNSTPAVVGVSSAGYSQLPASNPGAGPTLSYEAFVTSKKTVYGTSNDKPIIYFGSNDGMLHAVDGRQGAGGGNELFAYVPRSIIGNLSELAVPNYLHKYFVDGTATIADAYAGGGWKSLLMASVGAGGKGIYALDVTDPRSFNAGDVLWEFDNNDDGDMGQFVGRPSAGLAPDGKWLSVFGNGYNSDNKRAVLFIRDAYTGASIAKIDTGVGCSSLDVGCTTGPNGLATATLVDNTGDGVGDTIYAGDYLGNMWRFEYVSGAWQLGNGSQPIFVAKDGNGAGAKRQSITSGVYTVAHPLGGTMLVFGTGRYLSADDADDATVGLGTRSLVDTIYGIWDATRIYDLATDTFTTTATDSGGSPVDLTSLMSLAGGRSILQEQLFTGYTPLADDGTGGYRTSTRNPVEFRTPDTPGVGFLGWYIDLSFHGVPPATTSFDQLLGERVTATPQGILNDVVINAFRPSGNTCSPGAQNATLVFDALTGAASFTPIPPPGGWPAGYEPPAAGVSGTDTGIVPPAGEPPIIVVRPPVPPVPCLPGDPGCTNPPIVNDIKSCSWRSPNAANRTPGKLIPCGRISWKQMR